MEQIQDNQIIQEFMKLLKENSMDKGQDYSMVLFQLDGMMRQFDSALKELNEVKSQLAEMQEHPMKKFVTRMVKTVENKLHTMKDNLLAMKEHLVEGAKQSIAEFKQTGVSALDKAVCVLGIKKGLEAIQQDLSACNADIKKSIEKIEIIGHELRSVGGHVKNIGRAVMGKEQQPVTGGNEGRIQSGILAPMRMEKKILGQLNNMALAAIGGVERLERAAGRNELQAEKEAPKELEEELISEKPLTDKKPSILKDLQDNKVQAAAHSTPTQDKQLKPQEAAL